MTRSYKLRLVLVSLLALTLLGLSLCAMARTWTYEFPYAGGGVAGLWPSVAKNSSGNICAVYVGHSVLKYGVRTTGWSLETVNATQAAAGEAAQYCSLAVSGTTPHVAYYDANTKTLRYATKSTSWSFETVDTGPTVGKHTSIAVNSSGYPAITYYDELNNALKYAYKDGTGWHTETLANNCGKDSSIAFSGTTPHVAYVDSTYTLKHGTRSGSWSWATAGGSYKAEDIDIAIDGSSNPHISFRDRRIGHLKHAWKSGSTWYQEIADSTLKSGHKSSIAIDSSGYPRISHFRRDNYVTGGTDWWSTQTRYTYKSAGGWTTQEIQWFKSTHQDLDSDIVLDNSNQPCVAYYLNGERSFKYMYYNSGWQQETPDTGRKVGQWASVVLDGSNNPNVCYYDMENNSLYYLKKTTSWTTPEQVDAAGGDVGTSATIALLGSGYPAIAYAKLAYTFQSPEYNCTPDLKYAYKDGSGWHPATVQTGAGYYASMALYNGYPKIAYASAAHRNGDLRYANNDGSWGITTVDAGSPETNADWHNDGQFPSLAFDSSGNAHISYMERWLDFDYDFRVRLKHAWVSGGNWYTEILNDAAKVCIGKYTSIVVNSSGYPAIAYQAMAPSTAHQEAQLMYIYKDAGGWHNETVDSGSSTGFYISMKLAPNGYPGIAYKDVKNQTLKYAYKDASGWHTETVDSAGRVGDYACLSFKTDGSPYIAYTDWDNLNLKVAYPSSTSTGTIAGNVKDGGGTNVAGASVSTNTGGYSATTDANGNYTIANVSTGTYNVTAYKTGYNSQTQSSKTVNASATTTVNFTITSNSGAIAGTVKDGSNNNISGATVSTTSGGYSTTTNSSGAYTLSGVAAGTYSVVAEKSGYQSQTLTGKSVTAGATTTANFTLNAQTTGNVVTNGNFESGFTSGIGNNWTSFASSGYSPTFSDGTDQKYDGSHAQKIDMPQPSSADKYGGIYQRVNTVASQQYALTVYERAYISESYSGEHLVCRVGIDLTGGTDWQSGNVTWTEINATKNQWITYTQNVTATGNNVTIFLQAWRKWATAGSGAVWFDAISFNGAIAQSPGVISGNVKNASAQNLSGATVSTTSGGYSATTDSNGNYTISNVAVGTYDVVATKSGYQSVTQTGKSVTAGATTTVNFTLNPNPGTLAGNVKDNSSNNLEGATVSTTTGGYWTTTDSSGNYVITGVAPGTYSVVASKTGFQNQTQTGKTVSSDATTTVNFTLTPNPGTISGNVKDQAAANVSGATVSTTTGGYTTTTDASGNYTLTNVTPGTYSVVASKTGFQSQTQTGKTVTSGATTTVNFTITANPGTISGNVKDQAAANVSGATVSTTTGGYTTTTDASGNYTLTNVAVGTYSVVASKSGYNSQTQTGKTVTSGATTTCNFTITRQTGTIAGNVKDQGGVNVSGATVSTTTGGYTTTTNSSGNYTLSNVVTGTYSVVASKTGYTGQTQTGKVVTNAATTTVNFTITQNTTGAIAGNVKNRDGINISGATVSTTTGGYSTTTNSSGNYTLSNVAAGTYSVVASKSGFVSQTITGRTVTSGATTTVNFTNLYIALQNFDSLPTWTSSYDATWGSAATWSSVTGGQSGNFLQAARSSNGSSAKVLRYAVPTNTSVTISVYMKCPSYGGGAYWVESAYKLGDYSATDFDQNGGTWTLIQKFSDSGYPNGNSNTWTKYTATVNTGSNTYISIGYKHGASGCVGPTVGWDTFQLD